MCIGAISAGQHVNNAAKYLMVPESRKTNGSEIFHMLQGSCGCDKDQWRYSK